MGHDCAHGYTHVSVYMCVYVWVCAHACVFVDSCVPDQLLKDNCVHLLQLLLEWGWGTHAAGWGPPRPLPGPACEVSISTHWPGASGLPFWAVWTEGIDGGQELAGLLG